MTSNKLKIIACISMACDHIGYLLFPNIIILRYLGRLALPIFAFFIAEGCFYTRSKFKYFIRMIILAVVCQLFYIGESLINGGISSIYLNILFTFSLSIMVCSAYLRLINAIKLGDKKKLAFNSALFIIAVCFAVFCCTSLTKVFGIDITFDYGIVGVLLPLSALIFNDKKLKLICFSVGVLIYCIVYSFTLNYVWFSLLSILLIAFYNGKRGSKKLKWVFYLFYPLHFALIYGIEIFL